MREPALSLVCVVALLGCAGTQIQSNRSDARIYVDGQFVGEGSADLSHWVLWGTSEVVVEAPDGRVARTTIAHPYHLRVEFDPDGSHTFGPAAEARWRSRPAAAPDPWLQPPSGLGTRPPSPPPAPPAPTPTD